MNLKESCGAGIVHNQQDSIDGYRVLTKGGPVMTNEDEVKEAKRRAGPAFHPCQQACKSLLSQKICTLAWGPRVHASRASRLQKAELFMVVNHSNLITQVEAEALI